METATSFVKVQKKPSRSGLGIAKSIGLIIVFHLTSGIIARILALFGIENGSIYSIFAGIAVAGIVTLRVSTLLGGGSIRDKRLFRPVPLSSVVALVVGSFGIAILVGDLARRIPMPASLKTEMEYSGTLPFLFVSVVFVPLLEEVLFRGQIFGNFRSRYSTQKAVWASAVLFALFHGHPWTILVALPAGLLFAWLVVQTGSIIPSIISHAVLNLSSNVLILQLAQRLGYSEEQIEIAHHYPFVMLIIGVIAAAIGCVGFFWSRGSVDSYRGTT